MLHPFRISGIDPAPYASLFAMSDAELARHGARRAIADASPGYPCRVGLVDAEVGDELLLLPYEHQPAASPYRASGPIFVRRGAGHRVLAVGEVPPYVTLRLMSVRAYDANDLMIDAAVCEGTEVAATMNRMFDDDAVAYIHLHNAKRGCFSCRVDRA